MEALVERKLDEAYNDSVRQGLPPLKQERLCGYARLLTSSFLDAMPDCPADDSMHSSSLRGLGRLKELKHLKHLTLSKNALFGTYGHGHNFRS